MVTAASWDAREDGDRDEGQDWPTVNNEAGFLVSCYMGSRGRGSVPEDYPDDWIIPSPHSYTNSTEHTTIPW